MSDTQPSFLPGETFGATNGSTNIVKAPSAEPPTTSKTGDGCHCNNSTHAAQALFEKIGANASLQTPSLRPQNVSSTGNISATWQNNVHVIGLWSINQDRNCWVYLDNVGWRNLSGTSESGLVAMNMLAAHAYQLSSTTSLYEGDDGRISQLYVW